MDQNEFDPTLFTRVWPSDAAQLSAAKDDVIQKQADVIQTLQQIVKLQSDMIETLQKVKG